MKNLKKILLIAVSALAFAACGDKDDNNKEPEKPNINTESSYIGAVSVNQTVVCQEIKVDVKLKEETKTCEVMMNGVKFSENMPMALNMGIQGLAYVEKDGKITATGSDIHPMVNGQSFDAYTLNNIILTLENGKMSLDCTVLSNHGEMSMHFEGKKK